MSEQHFDIAIIGGGGGLTAASHAVNDGKSVALIDSQPDALGGTCVNRGCLPTKGLIAPADALRAIHAADRLHIDVDRSTARPEFAKIMRSIRDARAERARGVRAWVEDTMTPFFGKARFTGEKRVEIDNGQALTADRVFIATGARPSIPPIEGLAETPYLTNETALELDTLPESLVVIGGGYVGCEFAHAFSAFGSRITIIHPDRDRLLAEDHEIGDLFTSEFAQRVTLELGAEATALESTASGVRATFTRDGNTNTVEGQAVLVATGRSPNNHDLNLEATGVETDAKGWIKADNGLRTSHPDIYAYGDCIGRELFKLTSSTEGTVAYHNAQGDDRAVDYNANPHAIFTEPEIASVGLTEQQCEQQNLNYQAASVPYDGIAKGQILGSPPGLAKAIVEKETNRILGFHVAGPNAALLIHEPVLAMSAGLTADHVRNTTHIHPTMGELVHKVFTKI